MDIKKIKMMIMTYLEEFFNCYSDQADQVFDLILKIVNITDSDEKFNKKKQDILRKTILYITDFEVIDTIANIYIDLVCSQTEETNKELIFSLLTDFDANLQATEEKYTCLICDSEGDLSKINESFYVIYQGFETAKNKQYDDTDQELAVFTACLNALDVLQKSVFICKDNQDHLSGDDNKFSKIKNVILCIKGEDLDMYDMEDRQDDDIFEDIMTKVNSLHSEVRNMVIDIKQKQTQEKLLSKKKSKNLSERETREIKVYESLKYAESVEEVGHIIAEEIEAYDENMREESKKEMILKKYGPQVARSVSFYYLISVLYDKHDETLQDDIKEFMSFFPEFYLPVYFTINKQLFENFKLPNVYSSYLIKSYKANEEQKAIHDFFRQTVEEEILSGDKFLLYTELANHVVEGNILHCSFILKKLGITEFDEGMIYLAMFVKKVFMILKYIDIYTDIDKFIDTSFSMVTLSDIKLRIGSSKHDLMDIVHHLLSSIVDIYKNSGDKSEESISKVADLQKKLSVHLSD